jgi:hypothetical protein
LVNGLIPPDVVLSSSIEGGDLAARGKNPVSNSIVLLLITLKIGWRPDAADVVPNCSLEACDLAARGKNPVG